MTDERAESLRLRAFCVYIGLRDKERAMELLEKAYLERDWHIRLLKEEPFSKALRSEPRYIDLLNRVGLPH